MNFARLFRQGKKEEPDTTITVTPTVTLRFEVSCRSPSPPSQERDPRIKPSVDIATVVLWRSPETEKFWTRIVGTEHYARECDALFGANNADRVTIFDVMLVPEENFYDPNAIAVYRLRGGQVGHISRDAVRDWRPLVEEMRELAGVVPSCRAEAKRINAYPVDDVQIRLELTLPILRAELKLRRPPKPRASRKRSTS